MVDYPPQVWAEAAAALRGEMSSAPTKQARDVLGRLGYDVAAVDQQPGFSEQSDARAWGERRDARLCLLDFASRLARVFEWPLPDAPGGVFVGAEADPAAFGLPRLRRDRIGMGAAAATFSHAFQRCAGEGIEYLSQIADGTETRTTLGFKALAAMHGLRAAREMALLLGEPEAAETSLACVAATTLLDEHEVAVPVDLCLRTADPRLRAAASTGCAAGPTYADACLSGLLELIERDAAALWWVAGAPGRQLPLELLATGKVVAFIDALRGPMRGRRTFLLDITSDVGVPVVAAVSVDGRGRGFACGLGARTRMEDAAIAAVLDLCQFELAQHVVHVKMLERGPSGLNETDRAHLLRSESIDLASCPRLRASGAARDSALDTRAPETDSAHARLRWVAERVAAIAGCSPMAVDITRGRFGVPVAKVLSPGLQLYPAAVTSERLQQARARFGGSLADCGNIDLL